ncbi:MAG: hypothetical protein IPP14_15605 [Planctomycetes bacterium]|nr:hypothetical protein [Planctomycetota bacterium]
MGSVVTPNNLEAEQAVLGAVFVDPLCFDEVRLTLSHPRMFWRTNHQHIWRALMELSLQSKPLDWVTVLDELERQRVLPECGGREELNLYLSDITNGVPSSYGATRYAAIVRDKAIKRALIQQSADVRAIASDEARPSSDAVTAMTKALDGVLSWSTSHTDQPMAQAIDGVVAEYNAGGTKSATTGYAALDRIGGGWVPGGLYIIAARPGQGKSALIGNLIDRYARQDVPCGVVPLEMSTSQFIYRIASLRAGVDSMLAREARLGPEPEQDFKAACDELRAAPVWWNDRPKQTVADVAAQARLWKRKNDVSVVFVDYLQIMGIMDSTVPRHLQISEVTQGLKRLARELSIVVVAACQLNRDVENKGKPRRPTLADLKESGSIEEDADGVIGLYRERDPQVQSPTWECEIGWMKNRHGGVGYGKFVYERKTTRFTERSDEASQGT